MTMTDGDRGYALQQSRPVMLRNSIHKPQVLSSEDPILAYGFVNLINTFEKLTANLYDWVSSGGGDGLLERPPTSAIQSSLCKPISLDGVLEIQQVDILITQQWLQAMMWKLSMSHATQPGSRDDAVLPFHLPVLVGKAVMSVIGTASQGAVDAHGIGMVGHPEVKQIPGLISYRNKSCLTWALPSPMSPDPSAQNRFVDSRNHPSTPEDSSGEFCTPSRRSEGRRHIYFHRCWSSARVFSALTAPSPWAISYRIWVSQLLAISIIRVLGLATRAGTWFPMLVGVRSGNWTVNRLIRRSPEYLIVEMWVSKLFSARSNDIGIRAGVWWIDKSGVI